MTIFSADEELHGRTLPQINQPLLDTRRSDVESVFNALNKSNFGDSGEVELPLQRAKSERFDEVGAIGISEEQNQIKKGNLTEKYRNHQSDLSLVFDEEQ